MKTIPLTQGKVAIVDDRNYDFLIAYKWHAYRADSGIWYAATTIRNGNKQVIQRMHRLLLGLEPGDPKEVDHIDHNGLDNREDNIRTCNRAQNQANARKTAILKTSQYKGVYWCKHRKKWRAQIYLNSIRYHLGYFLEEKCAAETYDVSATKLFGVFAHRNF